MAAGAPARRVCVWWFGLKMQQHVYQRAARIVIAHSMASAVPFAQLAAQPNNGTPEGTGSDPTNTSFRKNSAVAAASCTLTFAQGTSPFGPTLGDGCPHCATATFAVELTSVPVRARFQGKKGTFCRTLGVRRFYLKVRVETTSTFWNFSSLQRL